MAAFESQTTPVVEVGAIVSELRAVRRDWRQSQGRSLEPGGRELPSREVLRDILADLRGVLFPMRLGPPELRQEVEDFYVGVTLDKALHALSAQVRLELQHSARHAHLGPRDVQVRADHIVREFALALPGIRRLLDTDVLAAYHGDLSGPRCLLRSAPCPLRPWCSRPARRTAHWPCRPPCRPAARPGWV